MPRVRGGTGAATLGYELPGSYEVALRWQCEQFTRPDPRLVLGVVDGASRRRWNRLVEDGHRAADALFGECAAAGDPVVVPALLIGGRSIPVPRNHPLRRMRAQAFTVYADDSVGPASPSGCGSSIEGETNG